MGADRNGPDSMTLNPKDRARPATRTELSGTQQQQLVFLNTHWGDKYSFAAPEAPGGQWTATAKFGQHDQIQGSPRHPYLQCMDLDRSSPQ
jgi:hypothetical protein